MANLKEKEELEARFKYELKNRAQHQKDLREEQLREAHQRKRDHQSLKTQNDALTIEELKRQVEAEKERQRVKWEERRQKEMRVLEDNQGFV